MAKMQLKGDALRTTTCVSSGLVPLRRTKSRTQRNRSLQKKNGSLHNIPARNFPSFNGWCQKIGCKGGEGWSPHK